jgi:hypothetical protein
MRRREETGLCERRGVKRLAKALSALLFALSIVAQIASPSHASPGAAHWLCLKSITAAHTPTGDAVPESGRPGDAGLDRCDHCAIGQAPTLSDVSSDAYLSYPAERRLSFRADRTNPGKKRVASASRARAPPAFS